MIPAFLNVSAGTAELVREALLADGRFILHEVDGADVASRVRAAIDEGHRRIVVAGGDGTIASAAGVMVGTDVELAVVPAGTLNHFAQDHGVPADAVEAVALARDGTARPVDVGRVNGRVFLNTSSAGAYVALVRYRERLEPSLGYTLATIIAALRAFVTMRRFAVALTTERGMRHFRTPLLFVGVGERELAVPALGGRVDDGESGLHVMVVQGRTRAAIAAVAFAAALRGIRGLDAPHFEAVLVDRFTVRVRERTLVSTDGEVVSLGTTLDFELVRGGLRLVRPLDA